MPTLAPRRRLLKALAAAAALPLSTAISAAERGDLKTAAGARSSESLHKLPRHALIIGNAAYRQAPLKNPLNDARAMADGLSRSGFQVAMHLDAGREEMQQAIRRYGEAVAKDRAIGVFYFAGHGAQLAWRNFLLPVDAVIEKLEDLESRTVDLGLLLQGLGRADNPMNVVILDACRDNPFGTGVAPQQRGLSQFDAPRSSLLAYATAPGNVAADGDGANGLYTEHLVRELAVPEAKIEDVFKRVRLNVRRGSQGRQIPWESTSLEEDFYFMPPAALGKPAEALAARLFDEELALWERVKASTEPAPLETYLRRYPSGNFSELAQLRLDQVLARAGEQRIRVVSSRQNPYSQGTSVADVQRKVGDSYTYRITDLFTGLERRTLTETILEVTDTEVIFDSGRITDLLGNNLRNRQGLRSTGQQIWGLEYAVGKRWSSRSRDTGPKGNVTTTAVEVRVVGRETLKVAAGTFDPFKIEVSGWAVGEGVNFQISHTLWLQPDRIRSFVKLESTRRAGPKILEAARQELVAYHQA